MGDVDDCAFEQQEMYDDFAEQRIEKEMKMALPIRTPRAPIQGAAVVVTSGKSFSLGDITTKSDMLPNRNALYAGIGFGKTSIAAQVPSPVFIMTRGETGLETLMGAGQLAELRIFLKSNLGKTCLRPSASCGKKSIHSKRLCLILPTERSA